MSDQRQQAHAGHFHAVQFYENESSLSRIVAGFLAEGFSAGQPAVVIATPEHRLAIEQDLLARSVDVHGLQRTGDFIVLDAREALATFMVDGMPAARRFQYLAGELIKKACRGRTDCTVRAYGEMVNLLWHDGLSAAAIRLETLWNELANSHDFKLLCGYAMGNFYKGAAIEEIKGQHSHLVEQTGEVATIN
jgi:hypothetical protein